MEMPAVTLARYYTHSPVYVLYIWWFKGAKENVMHGKDNNHDKQNTNWSKPHLPKQQWGQHELCSSSDALKWDKYKGKVTSILDTLQSV